MEKRVLFVDDDEFTRLMIERLFKRRGVPIILSSSGHEALQTVQALHVAHGDELELMLITDGHLTETVGDELIALVRERIGARLKSAVLITGDTHSFDAKAESTGYELIEKSFENTELLATVGRFLGTNAP